MKTLKYIALLPALAMTLGACSEDFLEVESPSDLLVDEYYNTESRIFEDLVAAYDPLEWFDWSENQYCPINVMSDIMADQMWPGGGTSSDNLFWQLMSNYASVPTECMTGLWTELYSGVKRSNDVLNYIENVIEISKETKALYSAEAKVLRAYYYTNLWKFWGNIPFYKINLKDPYIGEQKTADEVYAEIIADLDEAIANGGLPMKAEAKNYGRVTLAMAYMLYAEVVMYQKDESKYSTALKYMEEIISSGEYDLNPDYAALWTTEGEWCSESIWEINFMNAGAIRSWNWAKGAGGTVLPRLISPRGWKSGTDNIDAGWGFCQIRREMLDLYDDKDSRKAATIYDASQYDYEKSWASTDLFLMKYIARKGYNEGQKADADLNYGNNLRIYRYSETLLNAAELGSPNAQSYLDKVRERAGVESIPATKENIIAERALEFVGEGKRYWDVIRSGIATEVLTPSTLEGQGQYRTNTWSESKKYLPIPQTEINSSNGAIKQNPGY
ncbi:MAG: RagB/SusD family nutrient uptake outer membrane protein [Bacteroidales bacterium]|nr:RagB/SusD family nutrient uptake outer membrane protein [Bacteroidales bacterium]